MHSFAVFYIVSYISVSTTKEEEEEEVSAQARHQQQQQKQAEEEQRVRAWWKQKFPRELTKEPESAFFLSTHCKNRTRLYHTLLHYKFRLLLTIREKILRTANVLASQNHRSSDYSRSTRSQFDTSWEDWDIDDRDILLRAAVEEVVQDQGFVQQETRRFQTLIVETERRYGGRSEPVIALFLHFLTYSGETLGGVVHVNVHFGFTVVVIFMVVYYEIILFCL